MDAQQASDFQRFERLILYWRTFGQTCGNHGISLTTKGVYCNCADALENEVEASKAEQNMKENFNGKLPTV